ncbi:hypothetical protein ACFL2Z_00855 [Candidatus Eisenbacteria bacterium]|uniref:Uncharacterized protein n=1 Tax=Eiseniibacteriota bacterium TaxID=2212470 RepID=A0ABV6YN00_UNCEI
MHSKVMTLLVLAVLGIGCAGTSTPRGYVIMRDVPENPTFMVLPAGEDVEEIKIANKVEEALISAGVSVISRPAVKSVVSERNVGASETQTSSEASESAAAGVTLKETYWAYDEIDVDYIIHTDRRVGQAKIEKRETREILVIFSIEFDFYGPDLGARVHEALEGVGVRVQTNE